MIKRCEFFNPLTTFILVLFIGLTLGNSKTASSQILTGAEQTNLYFPLLKGRKVGVVVNASSRIRERYLLDSMIHAGIAIQKIFVPEHGFRGNADAGESLMNGMDSATHLPIIALYGKHIMPDSNDLAGIDLVVFDLQDVGVRFFTYLSTLHYVMKACSHWGIPLLILDRPNPNAQFIEGPVLDTTFRSFVGMHPVPILYGMTIGEYAQMIRGENWIREPKKAMLTVIPIKNYNHSLPYSLPCPPSPNLPNNRSIVLYPSLCLFEGTSISVGRGTDFPFQVFGSPQLKFLNHLKNIKSADFNFIPRSIPGKSKHPPYEGQMCYGIDLRNKTNLFYPKEEPGLSLKYIEWAYSHYAQKSTFFNSFFTKLVGNSVLRTQIENGVAISKIEASWETSLKQFKGIRKKYLLYP